MTSVDDELLRMRLDMAADAERGRQAFAQRCNFAIGRYAQEPEFRYRVEVMARILRADEDYISATRGDEELTMGIALKMVVANEELKPGGLLSQAGLSS